MVLGYHVMSLYVTVITTVDGRNPAPVEVGSLFQDLQVFYIPGGDRRISEPSTVLPEVI